MHVGARYSHAEWPAVLLDQDALLGAHLGSVSGVWASRPALVAALAHHSVGGLPLPAHTAQFLALADEVGPDLLQQTVRSEALKPAVNGRGGTKALRQLAPLAARAQPVDDAVQHEPQIGSRTPGSRWWIEAVEDRLDLLPEIVRQLPDRRQRAGRGNLSSRQGTLLSRGLACLAASIQDYITLPTRVFGRFLTLLC